MPGIDHSRKRAPGSGGPARGHGRWRRRDWIRRNLPTASRGVTTICIALSATVAIASLAPARGGDGTSIEITERLCETTGGGEFVPIPRFPGERIDVRLIPDVRMLSRRWPIFVSDGFSRSGVHARNGEHPLGLALDIVPDFASGGTWRDITELAKWAEPKQNQPRRPFRWVGYNGDPNHGRGNHLHLSWSHNIKTRPFRPTRTTYTRLCPRGSTKGPKSPPGSGGGGGIGARLAPPVPERSE